MSIDFMRRRMLAAAFAIASLAAGSALAQSPYVSNRLVNVDVYDRVDGTALPVYGKDGRNYIVGVPGHEYAVRIRNLSGARVLVVTSVDGVNVISGDTAAPSQSGYVLDAYGSVEIGGWRKSLSRTAAFYFTDLGDSYAARTGRPQNVGVIGVAVFEEKPKPRITNREYDYRARKDSLGAADAESGASAPRAEAQPMPAPAAPSSSEPPRQNQNFADELKSQGKLGTGHGRSEESRVTVTQFERASSYPSATVAIQYDRRDNLLAMGVIPQPTPYIARREPNPFPGIRFAPDPR